MAAVFGDASVYRVHLPNFRSSTGIWSKSWCWAELCWVGLGRVVLGPGSLSVFWLSFCFFLIDFLDHSYQVRVVSSRFGDARMCWMSPAQCDLLFVAWVLAMVWDFNLCLCACPQKWREFRAHGVSYGHLPSIIRALDGSWRCAWLAASLSRLVYEDSTTKSGVAQTCMFVSLVDASDTRSATNSAPGEVFEDGILLHFVFFTWMIYL